MALAFLPRRVLYGLVSLAILSVIIFICTHFLPGDAASAILGEGASPGALAALRAKLGLNEPAPLQFAHWLGGIVVGDFGTSTTLNQPAGPIIAERFVNSLALALVTISVAATIAIPLGVVAAVKRGSRLDGAILATSYVGISIPDFVLGPILIIL